VARIGFIPLAYAVHARIHTCAAVEAVLFINLDTVFRKGLTLLSDPLVEPGPDDVQESIKLGLFSTSWMNWVTCCRGKSKRPERYFSRSLNSSRCFRWT